MAYSGQWGLAWVGALCVFRVLAGVAEATDWPQWRGPNRDGISAELSGWAKDRWPRKEIWCRQVGSGCTSPIVAGGRLYTLGWSGGNDHVYGLNAATGQEIWKQSYACPKYGRYAVGDQNTYGGPTSTPTYHAALGYLYTLSTDGDLHCWEGPATGKKSGALTFTRPTA